MQLSLSPFLAVLGLFSGGCVSPPAGSIELDDLEASLGRRLEAQDEDRALVGEFEPEGLGATALRLPPEELRTDPSQRGYWMVRALCWSPLVRAARREAKAAALEARAAGAPAPVFMQVVDHQLGGEDELVEAIGAFDLIGLLGLGPSRAEAQRATAEVALALARLEGAAFQASLLVERARIRAVAAHARLNRFRDLSEIAVQDMERVRILELYGRLGQADAALARAEVARIERRRSVAAEALEVARRELAVASGVPDPEDRALIAVGERGLGEMGSTSARSPAWERDFSPDLDDHPDLRIARAQFFVREAVVREAAARAWPSLGLGPHLGYLDGLRVGAVLRLALPFPSSWRGPLEAAVERRDRAIEAFEETLLELRQRGADAAARLEHLALRADPVDGATIRSMRPAEDHWRAARALFRTGRGPLASWTKALNHLTETVTWEIDDAEASALARLELTAAMGPRGLSASATSDARAEGVRP